MGQQPNGWTPVPKADASGWAPVEPAGEWVPVGAQPAAAAAPSSPMNFAIVNGKRIPIQDDDGPLSFVAETAKAVNPLPPIGMLGRAMIPQAAAEALGATPEQAAQYGPLNAIAQILEAQNGVKTAADELWAKGDKAGATAKYLEWLIPVLGPAMSAAGDEMAAGNWWKGSGMATGAALAMAGEPFRTGSTVLARTPRRVPAVLPETANPAMRDALRFAEDRGIPVDAATATGSQYVKAVQEATGATPIGAVVEHGAQTARTNALRRVAGELVDAAGAPVSPEQAGAAVRGAAADVEARRAGAFGKVGDKLRQAVRPGAAVSPEQAGQAAREGLIADATTSGKLADEAYGMVRDIAADAPERVETAPRGSEAERRIFKRLASNAAVDKVDAAGDAVTYRRGVPPTVNELTVMRQIEAELDAMPYQEGGTVENAAKWRGTENDWTDGDMRQSSRVQARGGAPVYQDILKKLPGTSDPTRAEVLARIRQTLETGEWTNEARAAWDIAKDRLRASGNDLRKTGLPLNEGPLVGSHVTIDAPIALGPLKKALKPLYVDLLRQRRLNRVMMGSAAQALAALDELMKSPEFESLPIVDKVLGRVKAYARADVPVLRTEGQGIAAQAVKEIEAAVRRKAEDISAMPALEEGRAATIRKRAATDALEASRDNAVGAFRQLVAPGDTNIEHLRAVLKQTPKLGQTLGRALVDDLVELATVDGSFTLEKAKAMAAKWDSYGDATKRALFSPGTLKRLDGFVSYARRAAESPVMKTRDGDVGAFQQLVAPRDTEIANLRAVQQIAPDAVPKLARAYLEGLIDTATADGGFSRTAGIRKKWNDLGPATKQVLFPKAGQVAELDRFFLLADKLQAPLNTSKTAIVGIAGSSGWALLHPLTGVPTVIGAGAIAKLLQSPGGVRALTRGLQFSSGSASASAAARMAAYTNLVRAVRSAGVPASAAADGSTTEAGQPGPTR